MLYCNRLYKLMDYYEFRYILALCKIRPDEWALNADIYPSWNGFRDPPMNYG